MLTNKIRTGIGGFEAHYTPKEVTHPWGPNEVTHSFTDSSGYYYSTKDLLNMLEAGKLPASERAGQIFYVSLQRGMPPSLWIPYTELCGMLELNKKHRRVVFEKLWNTKK